MDTRISDLTPEQREKLAQTLADGLTREEMYKLSCNLVGEEYSWKIHPSNPFVDAGDDDCKKAVQFLESFKETWKLDHDGVCALLDRMTQQDKVNFIVALKKIEETEV
jgi:hypothetical protein